ncbi:glycine zipper family protein [Prodigiosinella confusarubida]|uniref:Glycine zipper family protein n=1 Tax=Serratia sp. (strain ATCC 39006) TaxID=104623 RepID=A0A2I5T196_SERS3|nr:glycine zipper family protein [Serratia sp. ATCC 39006]AUG98350.1 glycine zipper family protein [Serratia sp. ATCC 39006]AUH02665.1 glycine zipper family protein [Serratia sp. ATCC 39006]
MKKNCAVVGIVLLTSAELTGCVSTPTAPTVMSLPGNGKSYEQFQADDAVCKNTAYRSLNGEANTANNQSIGTAAAGAAIGTAAGALLGAASGAPRGTANGVAVGAASGLLIGSAIAGGNGERTQSTLQDQFDTIYMQCMYAKGEKIPQAYSWDQPSNTSDVPPDYNSSEYDNSASAVPPDYHPQ